MPSFPNVNLANRPLHFIYLCDCSGSMAAQGKMQALNQAIRQSLPGMARVARENPEARVLVRAVRFADRAHWHIAEPTPVEQLEWQDLQAGGITAMGEALELLAAQLDFDVSVSDLLSWQPLGFTLPAQGVTSATVAVSVADAVTVDIESDLQGIQIDLPMPWGKSVDARAPLKVSWHDREWAGWEVFWFGRFSAIADVPEYGEMATLVDLTPRTRPVSWATLAPAPGV